MLGDRKPKHPMQHRSGSGDMAFNKLKSRLWESVGIPNKAGTLLQFKIMTYNVLAQTLLETDPDVFKRCEPSHLLWEYRVDRLLKHIFDESPDVLCLQEVEVKHINFFNEKLESIGYSGIYKKKTGTAMIDGCATYFKKRVFELEEDLHVEFHQPKVSVLHHHHVGIVVKLKPCSIPDSRIVVANTHLLWNPKQAATRLAQLRVFLSEIDRVSYNGQSSGHLPMILAGDFNSHPHSEIIQFLEVGQVNKNNDWANDEWKSIEITDNCQHLAVYLNGLQGLSTSFKETELYISEYSDRSSQFGRREPSAFNRLHNAMYTDMFTSDVLSHSLHLQSVYDTARYRDPRFFPLCAHDIDHCTCHRRPYVDYIYYNARSGLRPLELLRLAPSDEGVPNEVSGSDHQSLVAIFELNAEKPY